ncbi:MAG: hypothetical protein MN733_42705, partial [Nitrososphaera sp.]|nr:hypothetical protein [Nitrososphaera sp.]
MSTWEVILIALVAYLIVCPPKYDPAILLKECNERKTRMSAIRKAAHAAFNLLEQNPNATYEDIGRLPEVRTYLAETHGVGIKDVLEAT